MAYPLQGLKWVELLIKRMGRVDPLTTVFSIGIFSLFLGFRIHHFGFLGYLFLDSLQLLPLSCISFITYLTEVWPGGFDFYCKAWLQYGCCGINGMCLGNWQIDGRLLLRLYSNSHPFSTHTRRVFWVFSQASPSLSFTISVGSQLLDHDLLWWKSIGFSAESDESPTTGQYYIKTLNKMFR